MTPDNVLKFAIVGHPNEGKSSVLSTLAEDDSVRISDMPGETLYCQEFPVVIDSREIIRFIDTPGFQNPRKILNQLQKLQETATDIFSAFRELNSGDAEFREDCELLRPIIEGAGIIYVVDGSRPVRSVDRAEMEILRLTGLPRMAVINSKDPKTDFLEDWKDEFRKSFNIFRVFNAHTANYAQRLELLESLINIDQDWQESLETVIAAFKQDWSRRIQNAADMITGMLQECLSYTVTRNLGQREDPEHLLADMQKSYEKHISRLESETHRRIRSLYKHNIFNFALPPGSILIEDLFSESTWKFLGLSRNQQIAAAGITGASIATVLDAATLGTSFGLFAALGGIAGATWAAFGGRGLSRAKILGIPLGGKEIQIGPVKNIQFLYILLDRSLIFYSHISNWAHGRRDYAAASRIGQQEQMQGYSTHWDTGGRRICETFFKEVTRTDGTGSPDAGLRMRNFIIEKLQEISSSNQV